MLIEDGLDPAVLDLFMKTKSWIAHCYLAEEYRALMSQAEWDLRSELDEEDGREWHKSSVAPPPHTPSKAQIWQRFKQLFVEESGRKPTRTECEMALGGSFHS